MTERRAASGDAIRVAANELPVDGVSTGAAASVRAAATTDTRTDTTGGDVSEVDITDAALDSPHPDSDVVDSVDTVSVDTDKTADTTGDRTADTTSDETADTTSDETADATSDETADKTADKTGAARGTGPAHGSTDKAPAATGDSAGTSPAPRAATIGQPRRPGQRGGPGLRAHPERRAPTPAGASTPPVAVRPVKAPISGLRQKIESTAALRQSLDAKEAEAQDLRASIEQLRQELDSDHSTTTRVTSAGGGFGAIGVDEPIAAPPEEPLGNRPRWPLLLAAALAALLLVALLSRVASGTGTASGTPSAAGTPTAVAPTSVTASGSSSGPSAPASVALTPRPWKGTRVAVPPGVPVSGPGVTEPGTRVTFVVDAQQTGFDVYEQTVRAAASDDPLILSMPQVERTPMPALDAVDVSLDGVPATVTAQGSNRWSASTGAAWTTAVVRYTLAQAVELSRYGRADAIMVSLTGANAPETVFSTLDPAIVQISCPVAANSTLLTTLCEQPETIDASPALTAALDPSLLPFISLSINVSG